MFSGTNSPTLSVSFGWEREEQVPVVITLSSCGSRRMARKLSHIQIGPDQPQWKNAFTCGGINKKVAIHGCFHKGDLHLLLMLLKWRAKAPENRQYAWTSLRSFYHYLTSLQGYHHLPGARLHQNTAHGAWSEGAFRQTLRNTWYITMPAWQPLI